jgi:hypothetical protein
MTETLRRLLPQALEALTRALEGERPVPAAGQVRKACGRSGVPAPQGPTAWRLGIGLHAPPDD